MVLSNFFCMISDFSSVGPCASGDENIFKPDICFPGKKINSAIMTVKNKEGKLEDRYDDWDGTSMATAGTSGCIALICQAHPDWSPGNIKTAIMNNADILINPINQDVFPFFNQGAGQINIQKTIETQMLVDPPALMENYFDKDTISKILSCKNLSKDILNFSVSLEIFNLHEKISPFQLIASHEEKFFLNNQ